MAKKSLEVKVPKRVYDAPTAEELRPTPEEQREARRYHKWFKECQKSDYIIVGPNGR